MTTFQTVGKPVTRVDGAQKVTGGSLYAADVQLSGMLHCKLLRSPHAHARIAGIDASKALALPGVERVVTAADLPAFEARRMANRGYNLLAGEEAVFYGEPVAAVIASDVATAEEALELVDVQYEPLPAVLDPIEAMREDAPLVRKPVQEIDRSEQRGHVNVEMQEEGSGKPSNVVSQAKFSRGDVAQGFADADVVVEHTWRSPPMHQGYIEPHVTIADYNASSGDLTVWTATQGQFHVRDQISYMLKIPETKVNVIGLELGGGFGGKISLTQPLVAQLAIMTGKPVKLVFTRKDDLLGATPSGGCVIQLKTGMKKDGSLTAIQARCVYDSGAYPGAPAVVGALLIGGYYTFPNLEVESSEVLTNKVSVGAIRAPGAHNATFAIESHMDMMARQLGLDPIDVRLKNAVAKGDELPSKAKYPSIGLKECLEAARASKLWQTRGKNGDGANGKKVGVGLAIGGWLGGLQPAAAQVELNGDGTITVVVGANDITGTNTSFAQIAAEELGVGLDRVNVVTGDTKTAPFAGMSAGSKVTFTVGRAVKMAAEDARQQMFTIAADRLEANPGDLEAIDGEVRVKGSPEKAVPFRRLAGMSTGFGALHAPVIGRGAISARQQAPGFTAQIAEVEVDTETGEVTVLRWASAQDAGFAINPLSVAGQIQGGTTQGIGIGLWEEMMYDGEGHLRNPSLLDYRMPTALDIPNIETSIVEVPSDDGPYGARGVGEPSIIPGAAAIANAIEDAIGARLDEIPATPERILRALGKI